MTKEEINSIVANDNEWERYTGEKRIYLSDNQEDKELLKARLEFVDKRNGKKKLQPSYDKDYYCDTCGAKDGACDPASSYCFHCNTDNWHPVNDLIGR